MEHVSPLGQRARMHSNSPRRRRVTMAMTSAMPSPMWKRPRRGSCGFFSRVIVLLLVSTVEIAWTSGFSLTTQLPQPLVVVRKGASSPAFRSFVHHVEAPLSSRWQSNTSASTRLHQSDRSEVHPLEKNGSGTIASDALRAIRRNGSLVTRTCSSLASTMLQRAGTALQQTWWCLPMALSLVPLYSYVFLQSHASMPSWWSVVKMDYLWNSSPYARLIVTAFLASNLSYLLSGFYLLARYRPRTQGRLVRPNGCSLLGTFVLTAGIISTLFHSVQALGPYEVAEGLCYVDHGVAISAISYFWHRCGRPSRTTTALSVAGLVTLVLSGPGYAWLHSLWHVFSAAAAVVWARDGKVGSRQ